MPAPIAVTKVSRPLHERAVPRAALANGTTLPPCAERAVEQHMRIDADQFAVAIGVAVAGAEPCPGLMKQITGQASQRTLASAAA